MDVNNNLAHRRFTSLKDYQSNAQRSSKNALGSKGPQALKDPLNDKAIVKQDQDSITDLSKDKLKSERPPGDAPDELPLPSPEVLANALEIARKAKMSPDGLAVNSDMIETASASRVQNKNVPRPQNTPLVIFFKGHSFEGQGMEKVIESFSEAKILGYGDKANALEMISQYDFKRPILLVGHGMGADTAIDIAHELNKPELGFRKIDLLVSLDALGTGNDIIPQNVVKSVNFIGNQEDWWGLFNDSPKIAKNEKLTTVQNILRPESHTGIDDSLDVQFEVMDLIKKELSKN